MMKKIDHILRKVQRLVVVLPLVASFGISSGFSQDNDTSTEGGLTYGPKIGLTSSGFYEGIISGRQHTGNVTGVAAGGFVSYPIVDQLSVSAELLYMQQGGTRMELKESIVDGSLITTTGNVTLHNVEFPVLLKAGLPLGWIKPQLIVGGSVGYNFAAMQRQDVTFEVGETRATGSGTNNVRSEFQSMQYGALVGLGAEVPTESVLLIFDVRYRYGINPINNGYDPNNLLESANDIRSNSFMFSIGIGF
ncbi:MAG: porin family protein [Cyclobacteriaceae bacterium]